MMCQVFWHKHVEESDKVFGHYIINLCWYLGLRVDPNQSGNGEKPEDDIVGCLSTGFRFPINLPAKVSFHVSC